MNGPLRAFIDEFAQRLRDEADKAGECGTLTLAVMLRQVAQDLEVAAGDFLTRRPGRLLQDRGKRLRVHVPPARAAGSFFRSEESLK